MRQKVKKKRYKIQPLVLLLSDKLKALKCRVITSYVFAKCPESLTSFKPNVLMLWPKNDAQLDVILTVVHFSIIWEIV